MAISKAEVIVVGAGVFGLSVALAARARGRDVLVLEAATVAAGASGGIVGALSPHVPEQWNGKKQFQLEALLSADAYWTGIAEASGLDPGYAPVGRIMPLRGAEAVARARDRSARAAQLWPEGRRWEVVAPDAWPALVRPEGVSALVFETLTARLHPLQATQAMAAAFRAAGGRLVEGARADSLHAGEVRAGADIYRAPQIVLAAGAAGFELLQPLVGRVAGAGVKGQAAILGVDLPDATPVLFDDGIYVVNHGHGRVAVGSTSEPEYTHAGVDDRLDAVIDRARALCPALAAAPIRARWAGIRPKARRRDPMLGPVPGAEGVFAALGAFKIGFGIAPRVGAVLAEMLDGQTVDLPESFSVAHHL